MLTGAHIEENRGRRMKKGGSMEPTEPPLDPPLYWAGAVRRSAAHMVQECAHMHSTNNWLGEKFVNSIFMIQPQL